MLDRVKNFLRMNIGFIASFVTLAVYIATAMFQITETGKTLPRIIGDGAIFYGISLTVCGLLLLQGLSDGDRDMRVLSTNYMFSCTVEAMSPYVNHITEWCEIKNAELLKKERMKILAAAGLSYTDLFDDDGNGRGYKPDFDKLESKRKSERKYEKKRVAAYEKAAYLKTSRLDQQVLMGGAKSCKEIYNLTKTKRGYAKTAMSEKAGSNAAFAIIFGYYTIKILSGFSVEALIWYGLQACVCLGNGIMQMINAKMFVTDDLRNQTLRKVNFLDECRSDMLHKPHIFTAEIKNVPIKIERDISKANPLTVEGGIINEQKYSD